jgi:hypothetical protein
MVWRQQLGHPSAVFHQLLKNQDLPIFGLVDRARICESCQLGIIERKHRHVMEMGLTLIAQAGLSPKYLVDAFLTSIYLINRLPSPVLQQESPYSKLFHHSLDYTYLRTFGCLCYPLLRAYASHKLSFRSKPYIFIGHVSNQKGYRCLDPTTHKVYLSRNVIFDETKFPAKNPSISLGSCRITASPSNSLVLIPCQLSTDSTCSPAASPHQPITFSPSVSPNQPDLLQPAPSSSSAHIESSDSPPSPTLSVESSSHTDPQPDLSPLHQFPQPFLPHPSSPTPPIHRIVTRSQTGHLKPKEYPGFKLFQSIKHPLCVLHTVHLPSEPTTFKQAATNLAWINAMNLECQALISNHT